MTRRAAPVLVTTLLVALANAPARVLARQPPATPPPDAPRAEPVLATGELMSLVLEPLYKDLKLALDKPPRDRKAWAAIYNAAVRLAEANNLLFFRSSSRHTSDPRWPVFAADGRTAAVEIAEAVFVALQNLRASDFPPIKAKLPAVSAACNACHRGLGTDARTVKP